jgi:ABC-type sugar transport system substrate-binding protein
MKKLVVVLCALCFVFSVAGVVFAKGGAEGGEGEEAGVWGAKLMKRIEGRKDAPSGAPLTPTDFPAELLPGIDSPGAIPKKSYFVTYSNGDMNDLWRLNHVKDMEAWGNAYMDRFDMKFMWTNAGNNSPKQVSDIESLVALKPDLLIVSANESEPLSAIYEFCQEVEVPFITVDRGIAEPLAWTYDDDSYILHISMDFMWQGVVQGAAIVEYLNWKYGKPIGNVVELAGIPGSEPGIHRSIGLNMVLDQYPDIRIVATRPTEFDRKIAYETMSDWLQKFGPGEIDAVAGSFDEGNLGALQAIQEAGRDELVGPQFGIDAVLEFLEDIIKGETLITVETPPYFGMLAFEYGIRYLNGEDIPSLVMLPNRVYSSETPEKKEMLEKHIAMMKEHRKDFPLVEWGGQGVLSFDVSEYYPTNWIEDPSLVDLPKYNTDPPIQTP